MRERCPAGVASAERFTARDRAWARALTEAQDTLAVAGAHLAEQGGVNTSPPQPGWAWGEDAADVPRAQHALTKALETKARDQLLLELSHADRAWVRSCGGSGAGAWLNAAPSTEVEKWADGDFCAAVRTRLGQDVAPPGLRCANAYPATGNRAGQLCAEDLDTKGLHAGTCKVGGAVGHKHNTCLLYTSPSPRDLSTSRMPSSA